MNLGEDKAKGEEKETRSNIHHHHLRKKKKGKKFRIQILPQRENPLPQGPEAEGALPREVSH